MLELAVELFQAAVEAGGVGQKSAPRLGAVPLTIRNVFFHDVHNDCRPRGPIKMRRGDFIMRSVRRVRALRDTTHTWASPAARLLADDRGSAKDDVVLARFSVPLHVDTSC